MICPRCRLGIGYVRIKTNEWVCRNCSEITPLKTGKQMLKNFSGLSK